MTPEMILAIASVITSLLIGLGAFISIFINSKERTKAFNQTAKKDEVQLLRDEVERLQGRVKMLESDYEKERRNNIKLQDYINALRILMIAKDIPVPAMPVLE